jgi:hypothetical protein
MQCARRIREAKDKRGSGGEIRKQSAVNISFQLLQI